MKFVTHLIIGIMLVAAVAVGVDCSTNNANFEHQNRSKTADLIIFSFDRPLQLYALLESVKTYMTGLNSCRVIYRTSSDAFAHAYEQVHADFPETQFMKQGVNPRADFKPLVVQALEQAGDYVIFAVDDIIMTDYVDLAKCVDLLEHTGAYGFYLRLGTHLDSCYTMKRPQKVPPLSRVSDDVCMWQFSKAELDWCYPNTVDMTLYPKKNIKELLCNLNYVAPNTLEGRWASATTRHLLSQNGLCFEHTKMVNLPLNIVQKEWNNRVMNLFSPDDLLQFFNSGLKIDIKSLFKVDNKAAHMEYAPTFVKRVTT